MKRLGTALIALGLLIESALAISLIADLHVGIIPLLLAIGLGTSALLGILGAALVFGGAVLRRRAVRDAQRAAVGQPNEEL